MAEIARVSAMAPTLNSAFIATDHARSSAFYLTPTVWYHRPIAFRSSDETILSQGDFGVAKNIRMVRRVDSGQRAGLHRPRPSLEG